MMIVHRCTECGHPDTWRHRYGRREELGACDCRCNPCQPGPPEVVPTFRQTGERIESIVLPGSKLGEHGAIVTCGCDDCKALHAQLTQAGPVPPHEPEPVPEPPSTAEPSTRQIRKWAAEHGIECPRRGRVPASVIQAYQAAH